METLIDLQRAIHGAISADLAAFAATRNWAALAAVLPMGVVFGAVHALTPGHGKSILGSYLIGSRLAALKATAVAAVLALTHVASAVVLALAASTIFTRTLGGGVGRAPALEMLSRGLLVAIGLWLLARAFRGRPHAHGEGLMVGFVAGLVPCPLTLFIMVLALARGVPEAGLTFAIAMMLGVLLTLSSVALLSIVLRDAGIRWLVRHGASIDRLARWLDGISGAILILVAGLALLR